MDHVARPIPIDEAVLEDFVTSLTRYLVNQVSKLPDDAEMNALRSELPLVTAPETVRNVKGEPLSIKFNVDLSTSSVNQWAPEGGVLREAENTWRVSVLLNPTRTVGAFRAAVEDGSFQHSLEDTARHEMTHITDALPNQISDSTKGDYYNNPFEVRAYLSEISGQVKRFLTNHKNQVQAFMREHSPDDLINLSLAYSNTWDYLEPHLSEPNKRKFLKELWRQVMASEVLKTSGVVGEATHIKRSDFQHPEGSFIQDSAGPNQERFEKVLENIDGLEGLLKVQCSDGNWNYDPYMMGLANGMILSHAVVLDLDPQFLSAPEVWLKDTSTPDVEDVEWLQEATAHQASLLKSRVRLTLE